MMPNQTTKTKSRFIIASLISLAILVFLGILTFIVMMPDLKTEFNFGIFHYQVFDLILFSVIPLEVGTIIYISALISQRTLDDPHYHPATAFINYLFLLFESLAIFLAFALGQFRWLNIFLIFLIFGFQVFSFPKTIGKALQQLLVPFILLATFYLISHQQNFDIITYLFKSGYLLTAALVIGGLLVWIKYLAFYKNLTAASTDKVAAIWTQKYLLIVIALYAIFIFLPALADYYQSFYIYLGYQSFTLANLANGLLFISAALYQGLLYASNFSFEA